MLDGKTTRFEGEVDLMIDTGQDSVRLHCFVSLSLVCGFSYIIGMDAVRGLGGVTVSSQSVPRFGNVDAGMKTSLVAAAGVTVASPLVVEDTDFSACFDGSRWKVFWKWKGEEPVLKKSMWRI